MILVDTSLWILTFRAGSSARLEQFADLDDVVTCLPVVQEVLQGFADESAFRVAREAMLALPMVDDPLPMARVEEAVALYRAARRQGRTVRSSVDCLIAASALHHDLDVLHVDRDFDVIAEVSGPTVDQRPELRGERPLPGIRRWNSRSQDPARARAAGARASAGARSRRP